MQTLVEVSPVDAPGSKPIVVFAHANGYPPESYRTLLKPLSQHFQVMTLEHRPFWDHGPAPRRQHWSVYAGDLVTTLERELSQPVFLVGHSMGAVIGMLAGLKNPGLFHGIVALDPVLIPLKFWLPGQVMRALGRDLPMVQRALRRPAQFENHDAAFVFYRKKRPFSRISDEVLWDYVLAGHVAVEGGGVALRWTGSWEACVYRSAPPMFQKLRGLSVTTMGIVGRHSEVFRADSIAKWQRAMPGVQVHAVEGGHLVPLENPAVCAQLITRFISG